MLFISKLKKQIKTGFTLAEMIIVLAIISIVTTLVLYNGANLNSNVLISNTAYEIGLIIRDVQISGLGVNASEQNTFNLSKGVYFNKNEPRKITFFTDDNNNGHYDIGEMDQEKEIANRRAGRIYAICREKDMLDSIRAIDTHDICKAEYSISSASIIFKRPNPEAIFSTVSQDNGNNPEAYNQKLILNIGVEGDVCRSVVIYKTGAVEVNQTHCIDKNDLETNTTP